MNDPYRRIAGSYDFLFSRALRQLRQDIRTYIHHKNFKSVVDICCGTGEQLRLLNRKGMHLCGIDNSLSMLERAGKVCPDRIELHLLDAEQDSFAPNSFDCAILSLALHEKHPAAARTIFNNCYRLIRDQGALIIADFNPVSSGIVSRFYGKCIIPLIERCAGSNHFEKYSWWMESGGLEEFLNQCNVQAEIVSNSMLGNLLCCSVIKNEAQKTEQHNFGLLDLNLRRDRQLKETQTNG